MSELKEVTGQETENQGAYDRGIQKFIDWMCDNGKGKNKELNKQMKWGNHGVGLREDSLYARPNVIGGIVLERTQKVVMVNVGNMFHHF